MPLWKCNVNNNDRILWILTNPKNLLFFLYLMENFYLPPELAPMESENPIRWKIASDDRSKKNCNCQHFFRIRREVNCMPNGNFLDDLILGVHGAGVHLFILDRLRKMQYLKRYSTFVKMHVSLSKSNSDSTKKKLLLHWWLVNYLCDCFKLVDIVDSKKAFLNGFIYWESS